MNGGSHVKLVPNISIMQVGDYYCVVVPPESEAAFDGVIRINSTGKWIVEKLLDGSTEEDILGELNNNYPGQEETIRQSVAAFFDKLKDTGLYK